MSKLFYDHLIVFEEIEREIGLIAQTPEEKEELWRIVDEIVHHKALGCILDRLPKNLHQEFLEKFHATPHDEALLEYLREKIGQDIEEMIRKELKKFEKEILQEVRRRG